MSMTLSRAAGPRLSNRSRGRLTRARSLGLAGLIAAALALDVGAASEPDAGPRPAASPAGPETPRAADAPADAGRSPAPTEAELAALRAEASNQLQAMSAPAAAPGSPATAPATPQPGAAASGPAAGTASSPDRPLRELLQARIGLLDQYEKAIASLRKAAHPEPSPEKQVEEARSELAKWQGLLKQAATNAEVLLPEAFRASASAAKTAVNEEMRAAIEAATGELKENKAKLEAMRGEVAGWEGRQNARRARRDKLFQAAAATKAPAAAPPESAGSAPAAPIAQRTAHEQQVNAAWKARVATVQLQAIEAEIALEARMAPAREAAVQVAQAQVQLVEKRLDLMQTRYREAADRQERLLKEKAAAEESTARRADDPLDQFRARRRSELLNLEAQVLRHEQALATSPPPSLDEQAALADRATNDFARVKELLDDGRVSRLDAIRLNNDFRRIGPERDRLLRNEMAVIEMRLQYYEDALTGVEIELLQDSLHDRYELELLKERLPAARWAEGEGALADLEQTHRALLIRHRKALEQLSDLTAQTLDQIARRLAVLDEEYSFIRTHIFWVRDREPIGPGTITQGARECQHLIRAMIRLFQESSRPRNWGRPSAEFITAAIASLALPLGLVRFRRMIRIRIVRDLPAGGKAARA